MITHKQYSIFLSTGTCNLIDKTQIINELQEDVWYVLDVWISIHDKSDSENEYYDYDS